MQNTSSIYKELIKQSGRMFKAKITCNFADGSVVELNDSNIMQNSLKISDATSNENSFDVGCAIINELDFEIDNSDGSYNNMSFESAKFDVRIGLVIEQKYDGTLKVEWLRKGLYIAEEVTVNEKYISIIAYDYMAKLDKDFSGVNVSFPTTLANLLSSVCAYCNVAYGSLSFPNSDFVVKSGEYLDESTSCRDVVSYIAQLACSYAYIDMSGYLRLGWYSDTDISIDERQRLNGTVIVTGVQLTDAADDSKIYRTGTTKYCLIIDKNPLIQGSLAIQNNVWTDRLIGMELTPFEATVISDPSLEAGDIVTIYDLYGNSYRTPITSISYQLDGKMTISCDAETVNEKQRTSCSQSAKVIAEAKKETQKQISEYAVRAQLFNELTANSMGFYQTVETQDDGSQIIYQHDKQLLSDSTVIWKKSADTFSVSTDGGETWAGFDKDGNAVLKILAAEGIIADWIKVGTLQGIEIIAETGKIAKWNIDNGVLVSQDGTLKLDSINNTLTVCDDSGVKLMNVNKNGIKFWHDNTEIGSVGITKAADTDTYGITFNLKNGDAMTWSLYNSSTGSYNNKLRYEPGTGFEFWGDCKINGNISVSGDIKDGNIADGISTDGYKPVTGEFWAIKDIKTDTEGKLTSLTTGTVKVRNGLITAW